MFRSSAHIVDVWPLVPRSTFRAKIPTIARIVALPVPSYPEKPGRSNAELDQLLSYVHRMNVSGRWAWETALAYPELNPRQLQLVREIVFLALTLSRSKLVEEV